MKKIMYTAQDHQGNHVSSFIDTDSNKKAIEMLSQKGYTNIQFYDDVVSALERPDLEGLSDDELERIAKFEAETRVRPRFSSFILEVIKVNRWLIAGGVCILLWGVFSPNFYVVVFGLAVSLSMPLLSIWNYRVVSAYDKLLKAYAVGDINDALEQAALLRKHMKQPDMAFDLELRLAALKASRGDVDKELNSLEKWRAPMEELSPGMFESRLASVYHLSGNNEKFVELMRDAFFKSSQSPTLILDLALAEARLGDVAKAEILMKKINPEELPVHGVPFIFWAEGAAEYRCGNPGAEDKLSLAVTGLLEFGENPAIWPSLAVCIGDYALSVKDEVSINRAKQLLPTVWEMLNFHGEENLLNQLMEKYPSLTQ